MFKGQCILHLIIALSTCLMLGGLLVPSYVTYTTAIENDFRLYLGVWYSVACQKSTCDVFYSGYITQKAKNWTSLQNINWENVPFVDKWTEFASLITIACGLCCMVAIIFTKSRGCTLKTSSMKRSELIVITVLLGLNVCVTIATLVLYFNQYPMELSSAVKEGFQVSLLLSTLGSAGAMTAALLCLLAVIKKTFDRQQSSSIQNSQVEAPIPMTSSAMAPTNQNDPNSLQSGDTRLRNRPSFDSINTEANSSYQLPLQPSSENPKLEPSAPPPPWWWNP